MPLCLFQVSRSLIGVGVVPNLFGEEVMIGLGGGKFDREHNSGVSRAYALVETLKINSDGTVTQKVLGNWIKALGAHVHALDDQLVVVEAGKVCVAFSQFFSHIMFSCYAGD